MERVYKIVLVGNHAKEEVAEYGNILVDGLSKIRVSSWKTDVYSTTMNTNFGKAKFEIWNLIDSAPWIERCWDADGAIIIDFKKENRCIGWGKQIADISGNIPMLHILPVDTLIGRYSFDYILTTRKKDGISPLLLRLYESFLIQELRDGKLVSIPEERME